MMYDRQKLDEAEAKIRALANLLFNRGAACGHGAPETALVVRKLDCTVVEFEMFRAQIKSLPEPVVSKPPRCGWCKGTGRVGYGFDCGCGT